MWKFVLLTVCALVQAQDNSWIVETEYGSVRGALSAEREIWEFQGIPYGGSVSGQNRYKVNMNHLLRQNIYLEKTDL